MSAQMTAQEIAWRLRFLAMVAPYFPDAGQFHADASMGLSSILSELAHELDPKEEEVAQ